MLLDPHSDGIQEVGTIEPVCDMDEKYIDRLWEDGMEVL